MTPGLLALVLAGRAVAAAGLWTDAPEARPAISHYGVMVEARDAMGGAVKYGVYKTAAAQLFAEFLAVPEKAPGLAVIGVKAKRYGSFVEGNGGRAVTAYFVRLGPDGAPRTTPADVFEANWCFRDRFYALGVPPGSYALAAVAADDTQEFIPRGRYQHQGFYLPTADLLSTSVTVGAGDSVFLGEVAFRSASELEIVTAKPKLWIESWQAKGERRHLRFLGWSAMWVYRASVAEDIGIDLAKMNDVFAKMADPVQAALRAAVNAASAFPLPGLAVKVELDRSSTTRERFMDNMTRDLESSPWGAKPAPRKDGQPPVAAAVVHVASAPGVPGVALSAAASAVAAEAPADARYREATTLYAAKDYAGAWGRAAEAIKLDPRHWKAWALIGNCQLARGDPAGARKSYQASLAINPDNAPLKGWLEKNGK